MPGWATIEDIKISIPASHAGGDADGRRNKTEINISIPASHAGGDIGIPTCYQHSIPISIPASHAGGDLRRFRFLTVE